jgi:hypothetical protein
LGLDTIFWLIGLSAEVVVLVLSLRARLFRHTPVFCSYLAWCLINDVLFYFLSHYYAQAPQKYFQIYLGEMVPDSIFQFAVLVELGWTVLRPIRSSLPRHSILMLALLFTLAAALIWPVSAYMSPVAANLEKSGVFYYHAQQTVAVLRVVIFMALAGFSQLLSIGWRDRELQIASGLGFYSMFSLAAWVVHAHQTVAKNPYYHMVDQVVVAAYLCSLAYWIFSFSQQEQERQEFTPQMRSFLLAVTGAARGTRMTLADSTLGAPRKPGKP